MIKKILLLPFLVFLMAGFFAARAGAESIDLSVTGNGTSSDNQVNVEANTQTNVSQSNQADVNNNVDTNSNTGGNNASENTGGNTGIQTGDSNTLVDINNQGINSNQAQNTCCPNGGTSAQISGNGAFSDNNIDINNNNDIDINQSNWADITNDVSTTANTGWNNANNNVGDVDISTGDITSETDIRNRNINGSNAEVGLSNEDINAKISGNGAFSDNDIDFSSDNDINYRSRNEAKLLNFDKEYLNTGKNSANGNVGDVSIETGDISKIVRIINENINQSFFKAVCCVEAEEITPPVTPPPGGQGGVTTTTTTTTTTTSEVQSSSAEAAAAPAGSVQGAVAEALPITGALWLLLATIASLLMFFYGWYLRLRSGNAPPLK